MQFARNGAAAFGLTGAPGAASPGAALPGTVSPMVTRPAFEIDLSRVTMPPTHIENNLLMAPRLIGPAISIGRTVAPYLRGIGQAAKSPLARTIGVGVGVAEYNNTRGNNPSALEIGAHAVGLGGPINSVRNFTGNIERAWNGFDGRSGVVSAFNGGRSRWLGMVPESNLAARYGNPNDPSNPLANAIRGAGKYAYTFERWADKKAAELEGKAKNWREGVSGEKDGAPNATGGASRGDSLADSINALNQTLQEIKKNKLALITLDEITRQIGQDRALAIVAGH